MAGIHTQVKAGRALVKVVILRSEHGAWVLHDKFTHTCDLQEALPLQMMNLADDLPHRLKGLDLRAVILRDRDKAPGVKVEQLKIDFSADGVVLAEFRRRCQNTQMVHGKEIGGMCGKDKATAESDAAVEFGDEYKEAGAAARAAATVA